MTPKEAIMHLEIMATNLTGQYASEVSDKRAEFFKKKIDALDMAISALREQSVTDRHQWISVKERLPDLELEEMLSEDMDLFPCLAAVRSERARGGRYVTKVWYNGEIFMDSDCVDVTDYVTHWMPLPEPPKEGAEG